MPSPHFPPWVPQCQLLPVDMLRYYHSTSVHIHSTLTNGHGGWLPSRRDSTWLDLDIRLRSSPSSSWRTFACLRFPFLAWNFSLTSFLSSKLAHSLTCSSAATAEFRVYISTQVVA